MKRRAFQNQAEQELSAKPELLKKAELINGRVNGAAAEHDALSCFRRDQTGLYAISFGQDGKKKERWIAPDIEVLARVRDFEGDRWGIQVGFVNAEGRYRKTILYNNQLIGDSRDGIETLVHLGFLLKRNRPSIEQLKTYLYESDPARLARCVDRTGWHGQVYVLPDRTFGAKGTEDVLYGADAPAGHRFKASGTQGEWCNEIGRLCSGNSRLAFAVSIAFAAPLLDLVKAESAGFHFRGVSSCGKTTALLVAGSVWGGSPHEGFLDSWRATANGIEARAALHNHALLCLDEIGQVSYKEVGEIVYALANGSAKGRMTKNITARAGQSFKLLFLSSGERSLTDLMASTGRQTKGGQEARMIEIPADAGRGLGLFEHLHGFTTASDFAAHLASASKRHYGTAIDPYLEYLAKNREMITGRVKAAQAEFVRAPRVPEDAAGEVYRVASTFALVGVAGEIATERGITGWKQGEAAKAVERLFNLWITARGGTGAYDVQAGIEEVRRFLEQQGASRFQDVDAKDEDRIIQNRAGYRETNSDGTTTYYFFTGTFQEVCGSYDHRLVAAELQRRGFLEREATGRHWTVRKQIGRGPRMRFFAVSSSLLEE